MTMKAQTHNRPRRRTSFGLEHTGEWAKDVVEVATMHARGAQVAAVRLGLNNAQVASKAKSLFANPKSTDLPEYLTDAWQRWVLFMDILRQRGNNFAENE